MIKGNITVTIPFSLAGDFEKISERKFKTYARDEFIDVMSEVIPALEGIDKQLHASLGEKGKFVPRVAKFDAKLLTVTATEVAAKKTTKKNKKS